MSVPQAFAARERRRRGAALVAHHERERSGRGQHVDVSAQQSVALGDPVVSCLGGRRLSERAPHLGRRPLGPLSVRFVFPASDGHVSITFLFGPAVGPFTRRAHALGARGGLLRRRDPRQGLDAVTRPHAHRRRVLDRVRALEGASSRPSPARRPRRSCSTARSRATSDRARRDHRRRAREPAARRAGVLAGRSRTPSSAGTSAIRGRSRVSARRRSGIAAGRRPSASTTARSTATSSASARTSSRVSRSRG